MKVVHWLPHVVVFLLFAHKNHHWKNDGRGRPNGSQNSFWTVSRNKMSFKQIPCLNPSSCRIPGVGNLHVVRNCSIDTRGKISQCELWPSLVFTLHPQWTLKCAARWLPPSPPQLVKIKVDSDKHCRQLCDRTDAWTLRASLVLGFVLNYLLCPVQNRTKSDIPFFEGQKKTDWYPSYR